MLAQIHSTVFCPKYGMWQCVAPLWFCPPWAGACRSVVKRTSAGSPKGFWTSSMCGQLDGSALASLTQRTHMTSGELCHGESLNTQCMGLNRERRLFLPPPPLFFLFSLILFLDFKIKYSLGPQRVAGWIARSYFFLVLQL